MLILTRAVIAVLVCGVLSSTGVRAECVAVGLKKAKDTATLVFEGTVRRVVRLESPEYAAELQVHRVWKGTVPDEITVYYAASLDGPTLREGDRLAIFAIRQTETVRRASGIPDDRPVRDAWGRQGGEAYRRRILGTAVTRDSRAQRRQCERGPLHEARLTRGRSASISAPV